MKNVELNPALYQQSALIGDKIFNRNVIESEEIVSYPPDRHYRIWYNNQSDRYSSHEHEDLEIILCLQNNYTIIMPEKTFVLKEGDILFIPPHSMHELVAPEEGARFILLFNLSLLNNFHNPKPIYDFLSKPILYRLREKQHLYVSAYASILNMVRLYFSDNPMAECAIYSELLNLLYIICEEEQPQITSLDNTKQIEGFDKFVTILDYIDNNYREELSLEDVAKKAGFSKYHFSRLFKQYANTTFYDYLSNKRIAVATDLLMKNVPVTDIAFQTGFNNLTTFCRCFKKITGCSPTQYKMKLAQQRKLIE